MRADFTCSGDMLNPEKKYNYDYYMDLVDQIVKMGAHVLGKLSYSILWYHTDNL